VSSSQPRTLRINRPEDKAGWVVEFDGHDIARALSSLTLNIDSSAMATATLNVIAEEVPGEFGEVRAYLPDATRDLLVRLGWTPPAEEATS
jgi:hypothetical protein